MNAPFLRWGPVIISYVLRLRTDALADGCFVGEVEAVASGQRRSIASVEQLAAFVRSTMADQLSVSSAARAGVEADGAEGRAQETVAERSA
jgi:hypothetical protein